MGESEQTTSKPFTGPNGQTFETFDACVSTFSDEEGIDDPEAFCAWLQEEGKEALSDPNADEVLTELTVEYVSAVDNPAQDSEWLIAKDAEGYPEAEPGDAFREKVKSESDWSRENVPIFIRKEKDGDDGAEKQVAFAPVLIPKEADKQGDVIPTPAIEDAAHKYLSEYRKVDSDHDLREGKGTPVESWTLKQDTTFELPDGSESRTYPKGTWVMGIKFDDRTWERVKAGELDGLSIYGGARPIDVDSLLGKTNGNANQTESVAMSTDEDTTDMGTEDDPGDNAGNGEGESVEKQLDAGQVSNMLATVGEMSGVSGDSSIKGFVMSLIESGDVDEAEIRNMAVLLNGGSSGGDGGESEDEGDGMGDGEDDEGIDLDAGKSDDGGDGDVDKSDADGDADDGGADDVEKSVDVDVDKSDSDTAVAELASAVETLSKKVETIEDKVDDRSRRSEKMDVDDLSDRIAKDMAGVDDPDVARKAIREQVEKSDEDDLSVSYEGITDDEDATAEASSAADGGSGDGSLHSAAANSRMSGGN